jgi:hypothetical protein
MQIKRSSFAVFVAVFVLVGVFLGVKGIDAVKEQNFASNEAPIYAEIDCTKGVSQCRDNGGQYQEKWCEVKNSDGSYSWGKWYDCCTNCNCGPNGPNGQCTLK